MRRSWLVVLLIGLCAVLASCSSGSGTTAIAGGTPFAELTPTQPPEPTLTPEPTQTPRPTQTPEPTLTPRPTQTPEPTLTPEPTQTSEPTLAPEPTQTSEPTATSTPEPEPTGTPEQEEQTGQEEQAEQEEEQAQPDKTLPPVNYSGDVRAIRTATGVVMPVRGSSASGFEVVTPCYNLATVSSGRQITGPIDVLIDPGHGGAETGAVGPNGLKESTVNLRVAELLTDELVELGYSVELTRYADHRMAVQARTELANALAPRIFISIHHNGGYPESMPQAATEVFVQQNNPEGARLGGLLFEEIQAAFADIDIDWMGNPETFGVAWRQNDEGTDLYGILRRTPGLVSVLSEAMFISTEAEANLLAQRSTLETEALALATAIDRYFTTADPGTGFIEGIVFQGDLGNGGSTLGCEDPPF